MLIEKSIKILSGLVIIFILNILPAHAANQIFMLGTMNHDDSSYGLSCDITGTELYCEFEKDFPQPNLQYQTIDVGVNLTNVYFPYTSGAMPKAVCVNYFLSGVDCWTISYNFLYGGTLRMVNNSGQVNSDNDLIIDTYDNCMTVSNGDQVDDDNDGTGNACEPDTDSDGIIDDIDWDDDNDGVPDIVDSNPKDDTNTNEINLSLDGLYMGNEYSNDTSKN